MLPEGLALGFGSVFMEGLTRKTSGNTDKSRLVGNLQVRIANFQLPELISVSQELSLSVKGFFVKKGDRT